MVDLRTRIRNRAARRRRLEDFRPASQLVAPRTEIARAAFPAVDAHNHLGKWLTGDGGWMLRDVGALLALMDECNISTVVNLDGRCGLDLEDNLDRYDRRHPGRFVTFCQLDWSSLAAPGSASQAIAGLVADLQGAVAAGARGLKVWKTLGLHYRDAAGQLVLADDERLDDVWSAAGELGLPILIHSADPVAFFQPLDDTNERVEELAVHPDWWFGDTGPSFGRLMEALESVVSRFPATVFIGAHVGCYAENLGWVDRMMTDYANFNVDVGGRMAELGRQPRAARRLFEKHPDRVVFGTDEYPVTAAAYRHWFRFLESEDEYFEYAPGNLVPPQGRWNVHALGLTPATLEQMYAANARRLLRI
ncbi:MAG: amidohydrolase family protein [Actinomycetota bacterium]